MGERSTVRSTDMALPETPFAAPRAPAAPEEPQTASREVPCQCCGRCSSPPWLGPPWPPRRAPTVIQMRHHLDLPPRPTSPVHPPLTSIRLLWTRILRARAL